MTTQQKEMHPNQKAYLFKPGQSGNVKGRPKGTGTRDKSVLAQAQRLADAEAVNVVKMYRAIIAGDKEHLAKIGIDVQALTPAHKLAAAEALRKWFSSEMKAIAGNQSEEKKPEPVKAPVFQTHAGSKNGGASMNG
ncbi:TPA: hypothetical protein JLG68_001375 [Escherichia coli]|nr:hypothetical protein [Escherichia coli]